MEERFKHPKLRELHEAIQNLIQYEITPEMVAEWTPGQRAWMKEHLEHLAEASKRVIKELDAELERRGLGDGNKEL